MEYRLEHGDGRSTPLRVGYSTPTRQADELVAVLREALARLELPAPVEASDPAGRATAPAVHIARSVR